MKNRRIFHHYLELEETAAGLWKVVSGDQLRRYVEAAGDLLRQREELAEAMRQVLSTWPRSCEAAFTAEGTNRIAFLGQAACCIATGAPEGATRVAWHSLSRTERDHANGAGADVLQEWLISHNSNDSQRDLFAHA